MTWLPLRRKSFNWRLDSGYWELVAGYWLRAMGVTSGGLRDAGYGVGVVSCGLWVVGRGMRGIAIRPSIYY
jgi:hypothetical protein